MHNVGLWRRSRRRGEQQRFEQAVLAHLEALYGYAMVLTRDPSDAEDLVQEACMRAIAGARQAMPTGNVKAWLFTILRNVWRNHRRRHTRGPVFLSLTTALFDDTSRQGHLVDHRQRPDVLTERRHAAVLLREAIESLPETFREVIVLRYMEGLSYIQIAEVLGCPAGTVMSRLNRARAALRQRCSDDRDLYRSESDAS
jgi:RNA polymerase sigma-70 factor (ECF subfamily)